SRMSRAEWEQLNVSLRNQGVELFETQMWNKKTGKYEDVMKFRKTNNIVSDNINNESLIFSKVYNDMPEEAIMAKLKYVYTNSYVGDRIDTEAAVRALKSAGIYDEAKTIELARDLADEAIRRIKNSNTDIIDRMKKYKLLNDEEKKRLAGDLHEIITTERRNHVGNTQLRYDFTTHWSYNSGKGTYDSPFVFKYGLKGDSIEGLIGIVFHENTHALQKLGKSAIPKPFAEWNLSHYADKDNYGKLYYDNLIEVEAYTIQHEAARQVMKALGL
ncbi:MAG: hypothetical protein ACLRFF_03885, partial [Alphaproteobacteria bacterium]